MNLRTLLGLDKCSGDALPAFVQEITDIGVVRVLRLRGAVGKEIGAEADAADAAEGESIEPFSRPLLIDFKNATSTDFSTVAFLVRALRRRMEAGAQVGIVHAPPELLAEIQIAKLEAVFQVFTSEAEALAALSQTQHNR